MHTNIFTTIIIWTTHVHNECIGHKSSMYLESRTAVMHFSSLVAHPVSFRVFVAMHSVSATMSLSLLVRKRNM